MMSETRFSAAEFDFADEPRKSHCIPLAENWSATLRREAYFEGRKRRPQERRRKKRNRLKRTPQELFFSNDLQTRGGCA